MLKSASNWPTFSVWTASFLLLSFAQSALAGTGGTAACSQSKLAEILAPATESASTVLVNCSAVLPRGQVITKRLIFRGTEASGAYFDCNGAILDGTGLNYGKDMIEVRSQKMQKNGIVSWSRPTDITIKNCTVHGSVRIYGMSTNGEGADLRASSVLDEGHTQRAQNAAPTRITLDQMTITGHSRIPFYISPGVTYVTLTNSVINGQSSSVAVYLDAESGYNLIKNNYIHTKTSREMVAIDGSAHNKIIGNRFSSLDKGGLYLYRNCGEGGTVRHQTPSHNHIINNIFYYNNYNGSNPAIWVASRNGNRTYCNADAGYPFGSSVNDKDLARHNVIAQNQFHKHSVDKIVRVNESPNYILENETVSAEKKRPSGCYLKSAYPSELLLHGQSTQIFSSNGSITCKETKYTCNDGLLTSAKASCQAVTIKTKTFECQITDSNKGCQGTVRCDSGQKIIGVRAACNLEQGRVPASFLNTVPLNEVSVQRASDNVNDGLCQAGNTSIRSGSASAQSALGLPSLSYSCREYDKNGGDCHIIGQIFCL